MNTLLPPARPSLSFVQRWFGLLMPLALVSCILVPIGLQFWLPNVPPAVIAGIAVLSIVLAGATLVLDARQLARRAREPGFNAWDEI